MMVNFRFAEIFLFDSRSPLANISCREVYRVLTYRMSGANISCLLIKNAERGGALGFFALHSVMGLVRQREPRAGGWFLCTVVRA